MLNQRKRFNYLSSQQRSLNSSIETPQINNTDSSTTVETQRKFIVNKTGSIIGSNHKEKQYGAITQQYNNSNRKSSLHQENGQEKQSRSDIKNMVYNNSINHHFTNLNKQNITALGKQLSGVRENKITLSSVACTKQIIKPLPNSTFSIPISQSLSPQQLIYDLETRIKQLEQQNSLLISSTEQKFIQMEQHLQKVQNIIHQKQQHILDMTRMNQKIAQEKRQLAQENKRLEQEKQQLQQLKQENERLAQQKEQLLKMISDKNKQIKHLKNETDQLSSQMKQLRISQKSSKNTQRQDNITSQKFFQFDSIDKLRCVEEIETQTDLQEEIHLITSKNAQMINRDSQTQLLNRTIEQLIKLSSSNQQNSKQINYRQKYESLFKKALQMQDEVYKLKQDLFDSQNQMKTIQQEFNTYKILNKIEKITLNSQ